MPRALPRRLPSPSALSLWLAVSSAAGLSRVSAVSCLRRGGPLGFRGVRLGRPVVRGLRVGRSITLLFGGSSSVASSPVSVVGVSVPGSVPASSPGASLSESSLLSVEFDDSDDVAPPAPDVDASSATARPAPASIAAETPAVTTPTPNHCKNRSTMSSPVPDRGKRYRESSAPAAVLGRTTAAGHRPSARVRSVYAQLRCPWCGHGADEIETSDGHRRPFANAGGCERRVAGGVDGCRFHRPRGNRPRRVRSGVPLRSAHPGPHGGGQGVDRRSRARQPRAVRARAGRDGQAVRAPAHRQHLPGRHHPQRADRTS